MAQGGGAMRGVATVAAMVLAAALAPVARAERPDGPTHGRWVGPEGHMAERLGLTEEQRGQVEALRAKDREALRPLREAARQTHEAFREALEAPSPDVAAVGQAALA